MELDRRRALIGYTITFVGLILLVLLGLVIPTPAPPPCNTAACNTVYDSAVVGLFFVIVGMSVLGAALFRTPPAVPAAPGEAAGPYSFTLPSGGAAPPAGSPPPAPAVPVGLRTCPGCGASVTPEYGFCPRCGRTLAR